MKNIWHQIICYLARVQSDDDGPGLGVVDDGRGGVEADHEVAQVPGDPVTAGRDTLLGLAQGGNQG